MARVTPSDRSVSYDLPEHDPIRVRLHECLAGNSKFEEGRRVVELIWEAYELGDEQGRPRIWETATISVSDGPGGPSKLKRIINAASGRDKTAPIAWCDDETLDYSLDGGDQVDGRLAKGLYLVVRGENEPDKKDPSRKYLRIKSYHPASPAPAPAATATTAAPPPAAQRPAPASAPRSRVSADF